MSVPDLICYAAATGLFAELFVRNNAVDSSLMSVVYDVQLLHVAFKDLPTIQQYQEPITRSLQLPHIPVTAFSRTDLFSV